MPHPLNEYASPHFQFREVACWDRRPGHPRVLIAPYPDEWEEDRLYPLLREVEIIRSWWGKVLCFGSVYRTPEYNRLPEIGGVEGSYHTFGRAADMYPPEGVPLQAFYAAIRSYVLERAHASRIRNLGYYRWGVHIDIAPVNVIKMWRSDRPGAELVPVPTGPAVVKVAP